MNPYSRGAYHSGESSSNSGRGSSSAGRGSGSSGRGFSAASQLRGSAVSRPVMIPPLGRGGGGRGIAIPTMVGTGGAGALGACSQSYGGGGWGSYSSPQEYPGGARSRTSRSAGGMRPHAGRDAHGPGVGRGGYVSQVHPGGARPRTGSAAGGMMRPHAGAGRDAHGHGVDRGGYDPQGHREVVVRPRTGSDAGGMMRPHAGAGRGGHGTGAGRGGYFSQVHPGGARPRTGSAAGGMMRPHTGRDAHGPGVGRGGYVSQGHHEGGTGSDAGGMRSRTKSDAAAIVRRGGFDAGALGTSGGLDDVMCRSLSTISLSDSQESIFAAVSGRSLGRSFVGGMGDSRFVGHRLGGHFSRVVMSDTEGKVERVRFVRSDRGKIVEQRAATEEDGAVGGSSSTASKGQGGDDNWDYQSRSRSRSDGAMLGRRIDVGMEGGVFHDDPRFYQHRSEWVRVDRHRGGSFRGGLRKIDPGYTALSNAMRRQCEASAKSPSVVVPSLITDEGGVRILGIQWEGPVPTPEEDKGKKNKLGELVRRFFSGKK